ncbi:branched-chain amino acid ABC transporter ATP-binding protein [Mycolicibacterium agri]|jgi:branched-chain amino acid transport system ATP-binding protein|uniref:ABC transporter ATP-binding protein n=1 Tax=Mycolicibacterium agri TaxID=36811 RepID=A0A2A7N9L1_MYCAG|nr:ABC transporter ATP-binding protein [Mycolicibacterium agri]PEG40463.1 branched-chain amino acid ABC transporter ATP-binding protein [Mycolicibacterium agri]GFG51822.1 ABC transporter ATP-binding protein [Mycolicibacterium agri]
MVDALLDIAGLRAGYESTTVLRDIDLRVEEGQLSVVIGPNGHGKTTLLRAISGLVTSSAGRITFAGQDITRMRPEAISARGLVHIPQGDALFPDMTVLENLTLGAFLRRGGRAERSQQLAVVYDIFPRLAERSSQRARTLSGGERRMLALGRGLMADARMLMIDEPSLGLAPVLVDEVYRQIARIAESGMTILLVEENFSRVRDLADRLTLIENGEVRASGTVQEVLADPAVAATYLGIES